MILTMKLISIAFDMDEDVKKSQEKQAEMDDSPAEEIVKPAETNMSRKNRRKNGQINAKKPKNHQKILKLSFFCLKCPVFLNILDMLCVRELLCLGLGFLIKIT